MSYREDHAQWNAFIHALKQEVKPALGCTEPVSVALACAVAARQLSGAVVRIEAAVSPNLMKNGMGVTIPGTGMTGLPIAAALGAIAGDPQANLEVLKRATRREMDAARALLEAGAVRVVLQEPCDEILYVRAKVYAGDEHATVTIIGDHTNVVAIEKKGPLPVYQARKRGQRSWHRPADAGCPQLAARYLRFRLRGSSARDRVYSRSGRDERRSVKEGPG